MIKVQLAVQVLGFKNKFGGHVIGGEVFDAKQMYSQLKGIIRRQKFSQCLVYSLIKLDFF